MDPSYITPTEGVCPSNIIPFADPQENICTGNVSDKISGFGCDDQFYYGNVYNQTLVGLNASL